jgi:hypothetical protein
MLRSIRKHQLSIMALLIFSMSAPNLCLCPRLNKTYKSMRFKSGQDKLSRFYGVQDGCPCMEMSCDNRDCTPNDCIEPDEQSSDQTNRLEKCLTAVILLRVMPKYFGKSCGDEDTANFHHSARTLRAQHICMQI